MVIDGIEATADGDQPFRTYGFAVAAGGVGQRFFSKYYEDADPTARTIVKVLGRTILSMPVSMTPLRHRVSASWPSTPTTSSARPRPASRSTA